MAPVLIDVGKELAKDPKPVESLTIDRTTASHMKRLGVYKKRENFGIQNCFFSLNRDESTSDNLQRVLEVLDMYYLGDAKKCRCTQCLQFIQ